MKKTLILFSMLISIIILSWCWRWWDDSSQESNEKIPFFVETISLWDLWDQSMITKTWRIVWAQEIIVSSQASWRVQAIEQQVWDSVNQNWVVIRLSDSSGIYTFAAQRANAAVQQAQINYEQTMNNLQRTITDTEIAIRQAENQASNSALNSENSSARLQLQQLEQQLERAQLDLETKIRSDQQTILNFSQSTQTTAESIKLLYDDVIRVTDELLWVTDLRKFNNDSFEQFLWIRNTATKTTADRSLRELINHFDTLKEFQASSDSSQTSADLQTLQTFLQKLTPVLNNTKLMLDFTDPRENLPLSLIEGSKNSISMLLNQVQTQNNALTQQRNSVEQFLSTYQQQQDSMRKNITALESQIASTRWQLQTSSVSADLQVEIAQSWLTSTLQNKSTTEAALLNAITQARIAANEAQNNLAKLTVRAPISWSIADILVDIWQEVMSGTPLFTIANKSNQQIKISLTNSEVSMMSTWQQVTISTDWKTLTWTITTLSTAANNNLWFEATIALQENVPLLWSVATVSIPLRSTNLKIPLRYITILNRNQWTINLLSNNEIKTVVVEIGQVWWSLVEVSSDELTEKSKIITNNVSNFDPNRFILTEQ